MSKANRNELVNYYESDPIGTRFVASEIALRHFLLRRVCAQRWSTLIQRTNALLCLASYYSPQAHRTVPALISCA